MRLASTVSTVRSRSRVRDAIARERGDVRSSFENSVCAQRRRVGALTTLFTRVYSLFARVKRTMSTTHTHTDTPTRFLVAPILHFGMGKLHVAEYISVLFGRKSQSSAVYDHRFSAK